MRGLLYSPSILFKGRRAVNHCEVISVENKSQFASFVDFPWRLYKDNELWAPPLKSEVRQLLDTKSHPFWKFSELALFLAIKDGKIAGRIAAIINRNHNEYHKEKVLFWGFFETVNDQEVANTLFDAAHQWGMTRSMEFSRGPMSPSTNYEIGLLVEGYEYPPTIMMPYNPPYYADLVEGAGFEKEKDLFAFHRVSNARISERFHRLAQRYLKRTDAMVRVASKKSFKEDCLLAKEIYDDAWSENWCFSPMTEEEIVHSAKNLIRIADPEQFCFVYVNSEPVAVLIMPFDVNPLFKKLNGRVGIKGLYHLINARKYIKGLRMMLFGVKKAYWKTGVPLVAFDYCFRFLEKHDYDYMEMGWTLEDNHAVNQLAMETGAKPLKRYRIYRKDF